MALGLQPEFVQHLTTCQSALYAYVVSLMGTTNQANDVLQEANLKLCKKADQYDPARPFLAWAFTFARFEVMAWRKNNQRSRFVLDDELVALVASDLEESAESSEKEINSLEVCLAKLKPKQRDLIAARYGKGETVRAIASRISRPENAVAATLYRVRKALGDCIETQLNRKEPA